MPITLSDEKRREGIVHLQRLFHQEFDEPLSDFRAGAVLDLFMKSLGPAIYNQAVQDARGYLQRKLDDLDNDVHVEMEI